MATKKFRIAICGGGVGGLTLALSLSKYPDIEVDIYEAVANFSEVGAGITVWPRTWDILDRLGVAQDLAKVTPRKPTNEPFLAFSCRKSDQIKGIPYRDLMAKGGVLTLHRADFHRILLSRLPQEYQIQCSKRLRSYSYTETGSIELSFEDNTTARCDVLIGADGIKSRVRRTLLESCARAAHTEGRFAEEDELLSSVEPVWSGLIVYRSLVSAERLREQFPDHNALTKPIQYTGKTAHLVAYPIANGQWVNAAAFHSRHDLLYTTFDGPWVQEVTEDDFRLPFATWEPEVQAIIKDMEKPLRWAVQIVKPLKSYVLENVAIMGDAAHAMSPNQGSGAGQAIEDGCILAAVLGHPLTTLETVSRALKVYDKIRQPFANDIAERSLQNGRWFNLQYKGYDFDNCTEQERSERLAELGNEIYDRWAWAWSTTFDSTVDEAIRKLEISLL